MTAEATVELLCLTQRAPLLLQGTISETQTSRWVFTAAEQITLDVVDCNAIVNTNDDAPMMTLHIVEQTSGQLVLQTISAHPREKRSYPRLFSMINLRLKPEDSPENLTAWMNGENPLSEMDDTWLEPEPFMNFSVNGVAFDWNTPIPTNTKMIVALNDGADIHRCIARVVRCSQQDTDTWEIALYFEQMSDDAIEYLVQLTMRLQDSML